MAALDSINVHNDHNVFLFLHKQLKLKKLIPTWSFQSWAYDGNTFFCFKTTYHCNIVCFSKKYIFVFSVKYNLCYYGVGYLKNSHMIIIYPFQRNRRWCRKRKMYDWHSPLSQLCIFWYCKGFKCTISSSAIS